MLEFCSMDVVSIKDIDKCKIKETKSSRGIIKKGQVTTIYKSMNLPDNEFTQRETFIQTQKDCIDKTGNKVPKENDLKYYFK